MNHARNMLVDVVINDKKTPDKNTSFFLAEVEVLWLKVQCTSSHLERPKDKLKPQAAMNGPWQSMRVGVCRVDVFRERPSTSLSNLE